MRVLVTGAGGFIGHHLVAHLKARGNWVRGVDIKRPKFAPSVADEFMLLDLRRYENCLVATRDVDRVYALAADMGGMGYLSVNQAEVLSNNLLIDTHTIKAARENAVDGLLYASSACVYPDYRQEQPDAPALRESDVYPAMPQEAYGWEKLVTERLLMHCHEEFGFEVRIARFHNIFGELGTWEGGREKVPAALCRKIALAKLTGTREIEIWGDGQQTRSFCHISDCIEGLDRLMASECREPLNLGQDRMITIDGLADLIASIAGVEIEKRHVPGPQGVRGRNSDNSRLRSVLGWEPSLSLELGLARTYAWIEQQVLRVHGSRPSERAAEPQAPTP
jgi:nucleoside-diphosphate-sugar epimerase